MSMAEKQNSQTYLDFNQSKLKPRTDNEIVEIRGAVQPGTYRPTLSIGLTTREQVTPGKVSLTNDRNP